MNQKYEEILLNLSKKAYKKGDVPVSALIVCNNKIIAKAYNRKNIDKNCLFHAEVICLQKAYKKLKRWNLCDCIMYISLEPCDMCKILIEESRIGNVYYILNKGNCNNKYYNTKYEQMFVKNKSEFSKIFSTSLEASKSLTFWVIPVGIPPHFLNRFQISTV